MTKTSSFSLYVHIPFCKSKCRYCDFYSIQHNSALVDRFITSILKELTLLDKKFNLRAKKVNTLYFGGGTPSLLSVAHWDQLYHGISSFLLFPNLQESSLECNPDSFSKAKASRWLTNGINRLSLGIQSLQDRELSLLGRVHNRRQSLQLLSHPCLNQFPDINVDIMYGIPGQTVKSFKQTLNTFLSFDCLSHVSAYQLTLSGNTPFHRHKKLLPLPSESEVDAMNNLLITQLSNHGFKRYEVSNFSKPSRECKHNVAYWDHSSYIGLGPSAHSFIDNQRFANDACLDSYCSQVSKGALPHVMHEYIDKTKLEREVIFLGLRTARGIDENRFEELVGPPFATPHRKKLLETLQQSGHIIYNRPYWQPTNKGLDCADPIARKLI